MSLIRRKLLAAGVRNLKEFGYPAVNAENILTDQVFSAFFVSMLKENKGHGAPIDGQIDKLLSEIKQSTSRSANE